MDYLHQTLTFNSNKIHYSSEGNEWEVMMDWEDNLMSASAAYVCSNGGDILEVGFGMGISAGYIQSHNINSHTIIENHPQIIPKAKQWAKDKPNTTIIEGDWYEVKDTLPLYDGLFYDTFGDSNLKYFSSSISQLVKPKGLFTFWNNYPDKKNYYNIEVPNYQKISVNPPPNFYFNYKTYYLPQCQL